MEKHMFGIASVNGYKEIINGISIKTINYGEHSLMVEFLLKKGAVLPLHSHINEQTGYLVKGSMKLFIDGKSKILHPGDSWSILSNVKHKAEILEDSVAIEVFSPRREDYIKYENKEDIIE